MPISTEDAVIARLNRGGKHFEILVDPDKALDVKKGVDVPLEDLVVIEEVFEDSSKGERSSTEDLKKTFGTTEIKNIVYRIIREGEVHLTTEQRRRMREERRKEIANIISRRAIDPQRKIPHPPQRILNAMEEAGVKINEMESAESQVDKVVSSIKSIIPISMEMIRIAVKVPPQHIGKAYGKIKNFGEIKKEEWKNDGSWIGIIEIPAGMQGDFYTLLNDLTKGEAETKIVKER
ncbi:MAG: ribosome assembly factor SBDS [Candidatus Aenigmarchaeota archaeon]|nr:ribosome assembly factor SBDS [Candidatus Aenigmarchaeota archaeon]